MVKKKMYEVVRCDKCGYEIRCPKNDCLRKEYSQNLTHRTLTAHVGYSEFARTAKIEIYWLSFRRPREMKEKSTTSRRTDLWKA